MKKTPNIDSLISLVEEIQHLQESKELLYELFFTTEEGLLPDIPLRSKIMNCLNFNEDE